MAQFGDFLGRLFSTGSSRGLSGDVDLVLPSEPGLAFYNQGLARHSADGDLVVDPDQLWGARGRPGLGAHLSATAGEGVVGFTDILIIVNREDWLRAVPGPASTWPDEAARALSARFMAMCEEQDIHLLFPQRPMQFHVIQDGGPRMESESIGLQPGEFVTGLLSNQYGRPTAASRALIAVHLNLPGTWEGYYEVGRLYNDQALFTLGSHWLDSFSHPALPRPALYRLQQQADGSFVHVIDPDVADQFELSTEDSADGPSVVTITDINSEAVAHLVLEVVAEGSTTDNDAHTQVVAAEDADELDETAGDPEVTAIYDLPRANATLNSDVTRTRTVVPEQVSERILTLRERGALLQKVHFNKFMQGYDVYIGRNGEVGTAIEAPVATLQVRSKSVQVISHAPDLLVNDAPLVGGEPMPLEGDAELSVGGQVMLYRDLRGVAVDGWPYVGELRRRSSSPIHLIFGQLHQIGRARSCRVSLPDKPHNDNIVWRPEVGEGATIRARNGEIPKSQFYTDSIMVASQHADIDLTGEPVLHSAARHCYTFIRRGADVFALSPTRGRGGPTNLDLQPGDQILIGNSVFEVDYPPADAPRRPVAAPPPPEPLSAASLAAAIDDDDDESGSLGGLDLPPAAGLGERGRVPDPVRLDRLSDSIIDVAPPPIPEPPEITLPSISPTTPPLSAPMLLDGSDYSVTEDPEIDAARAASTPPPLPDFFEPDGPESSIPPVDLADDGDLFSFEELPVPTLADAPPVDGPPPPPVSLDGTDNGDSIFDLLDVPPEESFSPVPVFEEEDSEPASPDMPPPVPPLPSVPPPVPDFTEQPTAQGEEELLIPPPPILPDLPPPPVVLPPVVLPPVPEPAVAAPPALPPAVTAEDAAVREVVVVDEGDWQQELSRPGRLTLAGWAVSGEVVVGNHRDADVIIPENRAEPGQTFTAQDYFTVFVRGRRARLALLSPEEARLEASGAPMSETEDANALLEVVRRDPDGEPDFEVQLRLREARMLPDPRARMLALEGDDPMVRALFAVGLPLRAARPLHLGRLSLQARYDGTALHLSDYLESYRRPDGTFLPVFVRRGEAPFRTAPEDGSPVTLQPGDYLLVGVAIYRFETD